MTIKAVYFDLGGVIVRTEFQSPREHLAERVGMTYEELVEIVFESKSAREASIGKISEEDLWKNVTRALRLPLKEKDAVHKEFFDGDIIDRELIAFIRSLRPRYKTGLISNAWDGLRETLHTRVPIADAFDVIVISAEEKIVKPDPRIYLSTLERLEVKAEEAIFLDDFSENIDAANALGLIGVHFRSTAQAQRDMRALLNEQ